MIIRKNKQLGVRGFTLVEVMAAVAVLSIGLIGSLTVITKNLSSISAGENRIIAANLAAEGIELVRNVRDTNWLKSVTWDDGMGIPSINPPDSVRRLKFFCGGLEFQPPEGQGAVNNWNRTIDQCSTDCKMSIYKIGGIDVCYSDNVGGGATKTVNGVEYTRDSPRAEYFRLIIVTRTGLNSIKVEVFIKYGKNGNYKYVPTITETLYNWK